MFKYVHLETVQTFIANPAHAALPRHARIQRAIRQMILDGALTPGTPLPSTRALAPSLGVSRDTAEAAYAQLHTEGFIDRRVGSGSFVSRKINFSSGRSPSLTARAALEREQTASLSRRGQTIFASGGVREQLMPRPFAPGVPETRTFPISVWERLQRQVFKEFGANALHHADPQGVAPLRRAIADYVNLERGARAGEDRVLVLTSSQQALSLCATVLFDPGERIFIENPVYHGARQAFEAAGLDCAPVAVDVDGIDVSQVTARPGHAKAVFLTPSHQYPTGSTLTLERRLALIEWAASNRGWIIEDDYDSEFHYTGRPTACVQGLDPYERTIYIGTFTKSLFPGLRLGYMILPPQLVRPMTVARTLLDGHTAPIAQLTLARFIEGGHFGSYVRSMRTVYAKRLRLLDTLVRRHLSGIVIPHVPQGGLQISCLLEAPVSEQTSIGAARAVGIDLVGISRLYASPPVTEGWLMGFAAYTPDEIESAVCRLAAALKTVTGA